MTPLRKMPCRNGVYFQETRAWGLWSPSLWCWVSVFSWCVRRRRPVSDSALWTRKTLQLATCRLLLPVYSTWSRSVVRRRWRLSGGDWGVVGQLYVAGRLHRAGCHRSDRRCAGDRSYDPRLCCDASSWGTWQVAHDDLQSTGQRQPSARPPEHRNTVRRGELCLVATPNLFTALMQ